MKGIQGLTSGSDTLTLKIQAEVFVRRLSVLAPLVLLVGCSVAGIRKHEPNFKNVKALGQVKSSYRLNQVRAGNPKVEMRLGQTEWECRGVVGFNMPAGQTVSDYIANGFSDELEAAGRFAANGRAVTIVVNELESTTMSINENNWTLDFDYIVDGTKRRVKTVTPFVSAYEGRTACRNTGQALTDALSENFAQYYKGLRK